MLSSRAFAKIRDEVRDRVLQLGTAEGWAREASSPA
jgi:hypothetical protein